MVQTGEQLAFVDPVFVRIKPDERNFMENLSLLIIRRNIIGTFFRQGLQVAHYIYCECLGAFAPRFTVAV